MEAIFIYLHDLGGCFFIHRLKISATISIYLRAAKNSSYVGEMILVKRSLWVSTCDSLLCFSC